MGRVIDDLLRVSSLRRLNRAAQIGATLVLAPLPQESYARHEPIPAPYAVDDAAYKPSSYGTQDSLYVHVPSFVRVERAPFSEFGPGLFGLAYTTTGLIRVRGDLVGDEFAEVLQHEIFHQLYPQASEADVRAMTRSRFGSRAAVHMRLGRG